MSVCARSTAAALAGLVLLAAAGSSADEEHHHHHHHKKKTEEAPPSEEAPPAAPDQQQAPPPEEAPPPAPATPAPEAAKPEPAPSPATAGLPRLTVHVYEEENPPAAAPVLAGFASVAGKDSRVAYRDLADQLDPPEERERALAAADADLAAAGAAFDQMDLENAKAKVDSALKTYERYLPALGRDQRLSQIRDAWIRLASIRFFDGNNDAAKEALRHVFVFDPKVDYSPKLFPPQMKKPVIEGRLLFDALGTGKLTVTSEPPGATVYVNGIERGPSPVTVEDAPSGPNYVTVKRRGFAPASLTVEVAGGGEEAKADLTLARYEDDPMVPLAEAREQVGADPPPPPMLAAMKKLKVEMLVAVRMLPAPGGNLTVAAALYDARSKHLLRKVEKSGPAAAAEETARKAAVELLDRVATDGTWAPPEQPKQPNPLLVLFDRIGSKLGEWRSSKYFWPSLAAAAGLVVIGTVVGVAVGVVHHQHEVEQQVILFGGGTSAFALPRF